MTLVRDAPPSTLFVVAPEPWALLAPHRPDATVIESPGVALATLERLVEEAPAADLVVGIGGGTALDTAKYLAWQRRSALVLVPSILSVDAAFTDLAGVREQGTVRYVGPVRAQRIVVDPDLIAQGPRHLNRAGVGDLLSCHTALHDWRLAEDAGHPVGPTVPWDDALAGLGRDVLAQVRAHAGDIGAVNATGVEVLATNFQRVGEACARAGHARFEEGSEHFFAYALEARTGRTYIHGELVAFATLALAFLQANEPGAVASVIEASRVRAHPDHLGITEDLFLEVLVDLDAYARAHELWYSIVDARPVTVHAAREVWLDVQRALPAPGEREEA